MNTPTINQDKTAPVRLPLDLGERSYDILIGENLLTQAGELIAPLLPRPNVVIITDENVAPHCLPTLEISLKAQGIENRTITLPAGEQNKSMPNLQTLTENLLAHKIDRKTTLIALGGGVIGDLTGFAAAITMRGIPFIQIPTSLLAQVDSSVGGKTGINTPQGKNLIGAFHQPRLVLVDIGSLKSLSDRHLRAGYAELVKYGLINDASFFDWCEENGSAILNHDSKAQIHAIYKSCASKAALVAEDEKEHGNRALLNLGHTFGHALEAEVGYSDRLIHGEAVAIGTTIAFDLSVRMGICQQNDADRIRRHLGSLGLPTRISDIAKTNGPQIVWTTQKLLDHMGHDKKTEGGKLTFIMAKGIGHSFITNEVPIDLLKATLDDAIADV